MQHFKGATFEARPRGSLFRRDPDGTVLTVAPGLYFANGVTPTADGSALVFAETLGRALSKFWLSGPRAGTVTPLRRQPVRPSGQPVHRRGRPHLVRHGLPREQGSGPARDKSSAAAQAAVEAARPTATAAQTGGVGRRLRPRQRRRGRRPAHRTPVVRHGDRFGRGRRPAVDGLHRGARPVASLRDPDPRTPSSSLCNFDHTRNSVAPRKRRADTPNLRSRWRTSEPRPSALRPWQRLFF